MLAKQTRFISVNPDKTPERNYPHHRSLITSSKCRLFLSLGILLRAGPGL